LNYTLCLDHGAGTPTRAALHRAAFKMSAATNPLQSTCSNWRAVKEGIFTYVRDWQTADSIGIVMPNASAQKFSAASTVTY